MAAKTLSSIRTALNRVTFGSRDIDEARINQMGWVAWVDEQLNPPSGDDPITQQMLNEATYRITYSGRDDAQGRWAAVDEDRPLQTLNMSSASLFEIYDEATRTRTLPQTEITRIYEESIIATFIRNAHSTYQVREFMADFWHRHFNIAVAEGIQVQFTTPVYDQQVLRANAFGNFRSLVEANAKSTAMLFYLDNADSRANVPNENYARELLELHTMGRPAYLGETLPEGSNITGPTSGIASAGFTDQDILQASRALSGWTVAIGQRIGTNTLPRTGAFVYEPSYHNTTAQSFLGVDLRPLQPTVAANAAQGVEQGRKVIELAAEHNKTGEFIVSKLMTRIFGENAPKSVADAALAVWNQNKKIETQIRDVMRTILLSDEISQGPMTKLRRPYERAIAFARTTNSRMRPHRQMMTAFLATRDAVYLWPSPDGWPDSSTYWLSTTSLMSQWNFLINGTTSGPFGANITAESIKTTSITALVDDWISRMVGFELSSAGYSAIMSFASASTGIRAYVGTGTASATTIENELRRLVALIATSPEFTYR
jgi:uncharacterized protein (DUF1800 family)